MKSDADLDFYLARQLDDAPLPDRGFSRAVTTRIRRHRRLRRLVLTCAVVLASVVAATGVYLSPVPVFSFADITPEAIVATMLLVTVCSLIWLATESIPPSGRSKPIL